MATSSIAPPAPLNAAASVGKRAIVVVAPKGQSPALKQAAVAKLGTGHTTVSS